MYVVESVWLLFFAYFAISQARIISTANNADPIVIAVNWTANDYLLHTTPSLQIVTNPLVSRQFSPISKKIFDDLAQLNAEYTRFAAWFPYPKMAVAELDPPSGLFQCSTAGESYPIHLSCQQNGGVISSIDFASYGTAAGACGQMKEGSCHSTKSLDIVQQACLGKQECSVPASYEIFGDPCKFQCLEKLITSSYISCRLRNSQETARTNPMQSTTKQYLLEFHLCRSVLSRLSSGDRRSFSHRHVLDATCLVVQTRYATYLPGQCHRDGLGVSSGFTVSR